VRVRSPSITLTRLHVRFPDFLLTSRPPPRSTLFPYTTLFRSLIEEVRTGPGSFEYRRSPVVGDRFVAAAALRLPRIDPPPRGFRSEEHTSELQSRSDLVCRLLLEKKKTTHMCSQLPTSPASMP